MLFDVYTEGTKARSFPLANQEFRQGPQGHWGSDSSSPSYGACSQTAQGSDLLYRWNGMFQMRKLLVFWCPCGDKNKALCIVTDPGLTGWTHPSGAAELKSSTHCLGNNFHVCAGEGQRNAGKETQGSWDLFLAINELCGLVCGWGTGRGSLSSSLTLVEDKVVNLNIFLSSIPSAAPVGDRCVKCFEVLSWRSPENVAKITSQWFHLSLSEVVFGNISSPGGFFIWTYCTPTYWHLISLNEGIWQSQLLGCSALHKNGKPQNEPLPQLCLFKNIRRDTLKETVFSGEDFQRGQVYLVMSITRVREAPQVCLLLPSMISQDSPEPWPVACGISGCPFDGPVCNGYFRGERGLLFLLVVCGLDHGSPGKWKTYLCFPMKKLHDTGVHGSVAWSVTRKKVLKKETEVGRAVPEELA